VGDLEKVRAEAAVPSTRQPASEDKPAAIESKPSTPEEKPVRTEEKSNSSPEKPAAENADSSAKQSDGVLPATGNPVIEPADRVGTVPVPTRAELEPRKSANGPLGCTHFRSFDPVSGTYMTFSGRRRQCQ
jgi:BA14K-like protein